MTDGTITLRALDPEDLEMMYAWENDASLWEAGGTLAPYSRKTIFDYIANYNPDIYEAHQLRLMITLAATGEAIGMVDLYDFDPQNRRAGVGVLVDSRHAGQGYGRRALSLLVDYSRDFIGMHQLWAVAAIDNEASRKAFEASGFRICGRLRSWLRRGRRFTDAYMMQFLFDN